MSALAAQTSEANVARGNAAFADHRSITGSHLLKPLDSYLDVEHHLKVKDRSWKLRDEEVGSGDGEDTPTHHTHGCRRVSSRRNRGNGTGDPALSDRILHETRRHIATV